MTTLELIDELWTDSTPGDRCPHVRHGEYGCRCESPACPDQGRRLITDHFSLQLWCLAGPERWPVCEVFVVAEGAT